MVLLLLKQQVLLLALRRRAAVTADAIVGLQQHLGEGICDAATGGGGAWATVAMVMMVADTQHLVGPHHSHGCWGAVLWVQTCRRIITTNQVVGIAAVQEQTTTTTHTEDTVIVLAPGTGSSKRAVNTIHTEVR